MNPLIATDIATFMDAFRMEEYENREFTEEIIVEVAIELDPTQLMEVIVAKNACGNPKTAMADLKR